VLREYADRLDISDATPIISLGDGGTPVIAAVPTTRSEAIEVGVTGA
jgi:threonine synthase